jgi:hypothetical protein
MPHKCIGVDNIKILNLPSISLIMLNISKNQIDTLIVAKANKNQIK